MFEILKPAYDFSFVAYAHEEGVSAGAGAWLGPALLFAIILAAVIIARLIKKNGSDRKDLEKGGEHG